MFATDEEKMQNVLRRIGTYMFEKLSEDFKVINLDEKRIQRRKDEIAEQVNRILLSGEAEGIRQTPSGCIIGNVETVEKLNALKAELNKLNGKTGYNNGQT